MSSSPEPRVAVVTGTSSGVGQALASALVRSNWHVLGVARRPGPAMPGYEHIEQDLADPGCVGTLESRLAGVVAGGCKCLALINNAAVAGQRRVCRDADGGELDRAMRVNVTTPVLLMGMVQRLCPVGSPLRVVNVSTGLATKPLPGMVDYCASKAALLMASRVFAAEIDARAHSGVFAYEPGIVDTEMQVALRSPEKARFPSVEIFRAMKAGGRLATPEQVIGPIIEFVEGRTAGFLEGRYGA